MGYSVYVNLTAYPEGQDNAIQPKEWKKMIKNLDEDKLLRDIYEGEDMTIYWVVEEKDKLMAKISSIFPNIIFNLEGRGEDSGDFWIEDWKGGKRIMRKDDFSLDDFISKVLRSEHPVLFGELVRRWYQPSPYDDQQSIINNILGFTPFSTIEKLLQENKIINWETVREELPNYIFRFFDNDDNSYLVKVFWDKQTQQIYPPQ